MKTTEELLEEIISILERPGKEDLKTVLAETIRDALAAELARAKREKDFHKRLNENMLNGLHSIYKEISQVTADKEKALPQNAEDATAIFHEASRQLEEIMQTTLEAADSIMNNAEIIQENQATVAAQLATLKAASPDDAVIQQLDGLLKKNMDYLGDIVIALSFQDLTGQRIKKVVNALGSIHNIVVETYVSTGLMLKKSEEESDQDFETLAEQSKQQAAAAAVSSPPVVGSELKGPTLDASQKDVDDLLAQLGF